MAHPESMSDFVMILKRQWKLILGVLVLYFITVYLYLVWQPTWYHADFQVVLETPRSQGSEFRQVMRGIMEEETIENAMELIKSVEVLELLVQTTRPQDWEEIKDDNVERYGLIIETMQPRVRTKKLNSRSFSVTCFNPDNGEAREFCHNLSDLFVKFTLDKRQEKKRSYRNRLLGRLTLIKEFLEKANEEQKLLKKREDRKKSLAQNEDKLKTIENQIKNADDALRKIKLYFQRQRKILTDEKFELDQSYLEKWPPLVEVRARIDEIDNIIAVEKTEGLDAKKFLTANTEWKKKKREELKKKAEKDKFKQDILDAERAIEKDKKEFEKAELEIRRKRGEIPVPDTEKKTEEEKPPGASEDEAVKDELEKEDAGKEVTGKEGKDNGGEPEKPGANPGAGADGSAEEKKPAEGKPAEGKPGEGKPKEKKSPADESGKSLRISDQVRAQEEREQRLFINQLKELDNSTNYPNFTSEAIREKVTALKSLAQKIQGGLGRIESVLETESSPYTIMNRMPYARETTISETQPLILLVFIALILAVGVAVLVEYLRGIPASELLIERVSGIEVLEVVPDMLRVAAHQGKEITAADLPILCHLGFLPGISDRFRIIKAKILMKLNNPSRLSLIITSCGPQEGKSTCAGNIAVAFAEMGYKTLLCSCNLRRPTLEKSLQISDSQGMSEILAGEVAWQELVHTTEIFNLYLIPSGSIPRDSSKLIFTKEFRSFFEQAKKMFDVVILDTPPILMVVDAMILSRMVDGMVLVYAPEHTPVESLTKVKKQVADIDIPILGIVVNWFESKRGDGGLLGRLKGYGYGGGRGYGLGYGAGYGYGYGGSYGHKVEQVEGASASKPPSPAGEKGK